MEPSTSPPTRKASAVTLIDPEYSATGSSFNFNFRFPCPTSSSDGFRSPALGTVDTSITPSPSAGLSMASSMTLGQKPNGLLMISDSSASGHQARKGSSATLTHDTLTSYNRSGNPNPESLGQCLDDNEDRSFRRRIKSYSQAKVDLNAVNLICVYACFITGFTNAISFSACYVWAGFQSANVANLGLALARTFNPLPYGTRSFLKGDQQLLVSLVSFCIGTSLGRIGEHIGSTRRVWLVGATFCQLLLAVVGTCCAHFSGEKGIALDRGDPSWASPMGMSALGLISASMGLQGIIGKRLGSPMNSTVVLTTTWVELFNDPFLFAFRYAPSRDVRIGGILAVFVGAFCSRGLIATKCGMTGTLGIMIGLRGLQIVWFCFMREEKSSVESSEPSSKV